MVFRLNRWPKSSQGVFLLGISNDQFTWENIDHVIASFPEKLST